MRKQTGKKTTMPKNMMPPKKKKKKTPFIFLGFLLFFLFLYPLFLPILAKYTIVKHISANGKTIAEYEMGEPSYSDEKQAYIITLIEKESGKIREIGISSKFFPVSVDFDSEK